MTIGSIMPPLAKPSAPSPLMPTFTADKQPDQPPNSGGGRSSSGAADASSGGAVAAAPSGATAASAFAASVAPTAAPSAADAPPVVAEPSKFAGDAPSEIAEKGLEEQGQAAAKLSDGAGVGDVGLTDVFSAVGSGQGPVPTDDVALKFDRAAQIAEAEQSEASRAAEIAYQNAREAELFQPSSAGVFA